MGTRVRECVVKLLAKLVKGKATAAGEARLLSFRHIWPQLKLDPEPNRLGVGLDSAIVSGVQIWNEKSGRAQATRADLQ